MPLRLLKTNESDDLVFEEVYLSQPTPALGFQDGEGRPVRYCILSHRWRREEVGFHDCADVAIAKAKYGWRKLEAFKSIARRDGFEYMWMDTCCIDNSSSTELAEASNSMFAWYEIADKCYAYLDDVLASTERAGYAQDCSESAGGDIICHDRVRVLPKDEWLQLAPLQVESVELNQLLPPSNSTPSCEQRPGDHLRHPPKTFPNSEWFTRGWTLQEMLAPTDLVFYDANWMVIGSLRQLAGPVATKTGVDKSLLLGDRKLQSFSIAQRLSWASGRQTSRIEDRAYSLFGILDVAMPIIYGEGIRSFYRLQEELLKSSSDLTLFAWTPRQDADQAHQHHHTSMSLFAESPDAFQGCGRMVPIRSRHRGQTHEVIDGRVQFETYMLKRPASWEAVICCYDDHPAKVVTLSLKAVDAFNTSFLVSSDGPRLHDEDIYLIGSHSRLQRLDVWRSEADAHESQYDEGERIVLCRPVLDDISHNTTVRIVRGEPVTRWNAVQQSFVLPPHRPTGVNLVHTLILQVDDAQPGRLDIYILDDRLHPHFPWALPGSLYFAFLRRWKRCGTHFLVARIDKRQLLHLEMDVAEIELIDTPAAIHNIIYVVSELIIRLAVSLLGQSSLWIFVLLPILITYSIRTMQMNAIGSHSMSMLEYTEAAGLGFATPLPLFAAAWTMARIRVMSSDLYSRLQMELRSVLYIFGVGARPVCVMLIHIVSIVLCVLYQNVARQHRSKLDVYGFLAKSEYSGLDQERSAIIATLVGMVIRLPLLLVPLRIVDSIRFVAALGLAIPLLKTGVVGNPYTAPWTHYACEKRNVALPFYDLYSNSTAF